MGRRRRHASGTVAANRKTVLTPRGPAAWPGWIQTSAAPSASSAAASSGSRSRSSALFARTGIGADATPIAGPRASVCGRKARRPPPPHGGAGRRLRPLDALEEALDGAQEALGLFEVRRVAAALEQHPLAVGHALVDDAHDVGAHLVVLAGDEQ